MSTSTPRSPSLGYAFRPRKAINGKTGAHFTAFLPAISSEALKAKSADLRTMRIHEHTDLTLDDLAAWLNADRRWVDALLRPVLPSALDPLLRRVSFYLRRWAGKKYKRLRTHKRFQRWWIGLQAREPDLFAHWEWARSY